jgi:hypothetical protein
MYWNGYAWIEAVLNSNAPQNVRADSDLSIDNSNNIYFIATDNRIHRMTWGAGIWSEAALNTSAPQNVRSKSPLSIDQLGKIYFVATDNRVHQYYWNGTSWVEAALNSGGPQDVMPESDLTVDPNGSVYYVGTDARIHEYYWNGSIWQHAVLNPSAPQNARIAVVGVNIVSRSPLTSDAAGNIYFVATDNRVHKYAWAGTWQESALNTSAPQNVRLSSSLVTDDLGKIYFIATDNRIHQYWPSGSSWIEAINSSLDPQNVSNALATDGDNLFFTATDLRVWTSYWGCKNIFKSLEEEYQKPEENPQEPEFVLYPNPCSNYVYLRLQEQNIASITIRIFDNTGRLILQKETKDETTLEFNLIDLSAGMYIVQAYDGSKFISKRLI